MRGAVVVALLLSLTLVPIAHASGGVIDTVAIVGDGVIGEGPIDVNITIVGVGGASSAFLSSKSSGIISERRSLLCNIACARSFGETARRSFASIGITAAT